MSLSTRLRKQANKLPGVTETIACEGTAIEQASFKVGKKSFLFVQPKDGGFVIRLKLDASAKEAQASPVAEVGIGGWVTVRLAKGDAPPGRLSSWVKESHALSSGPAGAKKKVAKKTRRVAKKA